MFSGKGFEFKPTGLLDGFESVIKELPQIAERQMGPLESSLQGQLQKAVDSVVDEYKDFSKAWDADWAARMAPGAPGEKAASPVKARLQNAVADLDGVKAGGGAGNS